MTKNITITIPDACDTVPMNMLAILRADAREAINARDAIDDFFSQEWVAAHHAAIIACKASNDEMERLAKNRETRHGDWRTPFDIELMTLGYI
jgi:hypothetical protein